MASDHVSSDPVPQCSTKALSLGPQSQENVPQAAETVTTSNELDLLFSLVWGILERIFKMQDQKESQNRPNQAQGGKDKVNPKP
ncbi:hypothetical protein Tco_0181971, partial [Tanacetum coccineum]